MQKRSKNLVQRLHTRRVLMHVALGAFAAVSASKVLASQLDFEMVNRTNQPIVSLWATPSHMTNWGAPFRNTYVAAGGGSQVVQFAETVGCYYDIQIQFSQGAVRFWRNVNLCQVRGFQVYVANSEVMASTW